MPLVVTLAAFFAGLVLRESEFSHRAAEDSPPFRDAFAVLFSQCAASPRRGERVTAP